MLSTLTIIVITTLYCVVHSITASKKMKTWASEKFGPETTRWYRVAFNTLSFVSFIPVLWLLRVMPDKLIYFLPLPWAILTLIIQICGFILIAVGIIQTGVKPFSGLQLLLSKEQPPESSEFVKTGLYGWVRHPLYVGALLILWPATSMTVNLLAFLLICTIYFVVGAGLEEKRHVEAFGEAYVKYQQDVPMLLPDIRRLVNLVVKRNS